MKHTIILICKGDTPPMQAIIDLLSQAGIEIEHASRREGGKSIIEIGTPQDLEDVPLPKEATNLKFPPEQELMFRKLMEIDQQGATTLNELRSFARYEKKSDKAKDPEGHAPKKRGKKNEEGGAGKVTPEPENKTADASAADEKPADEKSANADTAQEGDSGASAQTQSAGEEQKQETQGTTEGDTQSTEA